MKKAPPTVKLSAPDWKVTNPGYETSPTRTYRLNGREVVEIDGGKLYELATLHELMGAKWPS